MVLYSNGRTKKSTQILFLTIELGSDSIDSSSLRVGSFDIKYALNENLLFKIHLDIVICSYLVLIREPLT